MLSAAGLPPFAGFFSKLLIVIALVQGNHIGFAVVAVLASLLTLGYFTNLQRQAFFGHSLASLGQVTEANAGYLVPAIALSLITVLVGLFFPFLVDSSFSFLLLSKPLPF
jgi:multicomponent Na+:H+ antiporter subunit D